MQRVISAKRRAWSVAGARPPERSDIRRTLRVLCIATGLALSACISVEGQTPKQIKKSFLESSTVRSVAWFYPRGVPQDMNTYVAPTAEAQAAIRSHLEQLGNALAKLHKLRRPAIERLLGMPTAPEAKGTIRLSKVPAPIAKIGPKGEIQISYLVLQAILRGALLEDVVEKTDSMDSHRFGDDDSKYVFNDSLQPQNATPEQQRGLANVVDLIAQARSAKAPGALGAIWASAHADDLEDDPWFKLVDLQDQLSKVESSYAGAIMFLIAHEQGHIVLGHYDRLNSQTDSTSYCATQVELEKEADDYALVLLSLTAADMPLPDWIYQGRSGALTGYRNFLQYSYPLAQFREGAGCAYPSNKSRFERLAVRHKTLQDQAQKLLEKMFEEEMSKKLLKLKVKQQP